MKKSTNLQPSNPTYFLIAGKWQLEFANTSRVTSLKENGSIPANQPRFLSWSFGSHVRHLIACIGCEFVEKPVNPINDVYAISSSPQWGIRFRKIEKAERDNKGNDKTHYLQVTQTRKIFAVLQR